MLKFIIEILQTNLKYLYNQTKIETLTDILYEHFRYYSIDNVETFNKLLDYFKLYHPNVNYDLSYIERFLKEYVSDKNILTLRNELHNLFFQTSLINANIIYDFKTNENGKSDVLKNFIDVIIIDISYPKEIRKYGTLLSPNYKNHLLNNYTKDNMKNNITNVVNKQLTELTNVVNKQLIELVNNKTDNENMSDTQHYEFVNHPQHYNQWSLETIDMMIKVYGKEKVADWCEITAFKYATRMGFKPTDNIQQDIDKRNWYLNKAKELRNII